MRYLRGLLEYLGWVYLAIFVHIPRFMYDHLKRYHFLTWVLVAMIFALLHPVLWTTQHHPDGQQLHSPYLNSSGDLPYEFFHVSDSVVWSIVRHEINTFFLGKNPALDGKFPGMTWLQLHPLKRGDGREEPSHGEGNFTLIHKRFTLRECLDLVDRLEKRSHVKNHTRVIFLTEVIVYPEDELTVSRLNLTQWNKGDRPPLWLLSRSAEFVDFVYGKVITKLVYTSLVLHCFCCLFDIVSTDRRRLRRFINFNTILNFFIYLHLSQMSRIYHDFTSFHTTTFDKEDMSFQLISGERVADTANIIADTKFYLWKKYDVREENDHQLLNNTAGKPDEAVTLGVNIKEKNEKNGTLHEVDDDYYDYESFVDDDDDPEYDHDLYETTELNEKSGNISRNTNITTIRQIEELFHIFKDFKHEARFVLVLCVGKILYEIMYRAWIIKEIYITSFITFMPIALSIHWLGFNGDMTFWQSVHNAFGQISQILPGVDNPFTWVIGILMCLLIKKSNYRYPYIEGHTLCLDENQTDGSP